MHVREVMTRQVECTRPDATLQEVAQRMKVLDAGAMPVCDDDRLVGMITDRDITIRATAAGRVPAAATVREAMTPELIYCYDDEDVAEAVRLMREKQVRRLVVLNRDKRLAGIVSLGDLAVEIGGGRTVGDTLEAVSEPERFAW